MEQYGLIIGHGVIYVKMHTWIIMSLFFIGIPKIKVGWRMNFHVKIEYMMENFSQFQIPQKLFAPPAYRLFWLIHIESLPPIFQSIKIRTILFSVLFFLFGEMSFLWPHNNLGLNLIAPCIWFFIGVALGYYKAKGMNLNAKVIGIPSWDEYDPLSFVPRPNWEHDLFPRRGKIPPS